MTPPSSSTPGAAAHFARTESPAPRDRWAAIHASDPYALPTQTPEWVDVMVAAGPWIDTSVWHEMADGRELILPLVRRRIGGAYSQHSSFGEGWGMGGLLAADGPTSAEIAAVLQSLVSLRAVQTSIRPNPLLGTRWREASGSVDVLSIEKSAHVLDLTGGPDTVHDTRLGKQARRNVRRAGRLGVEVRTNPSAGLEQFYGMLLKSFDRWAEQSHEPRRLARYRGTRRDPFSKFSTMSSILGDGLRLHVATIDGVPAAAAMVLIAGMTAHYTRGVMDVDVAGRTNASDYVQWAAIRDAAELGCTTYHMGESGTSTSLAQFKEKFGARRVPYAQYRIERLPLTAADATARNAVKKLIGFRDA